LNNSGREAELTQKHNHLQIKASCLNFYIEDKIKALDSESPNMVAATRDTIACIRSFLLIACILTSATSALAQEVIFMDGFEEGDFDSDGVGDSTDDCSDFDPASTSKGAPPDSAVADRTQDNYNITWVAGQEIDGTAFDDQIIAGGERNIIFAGAGNDVIDAGGGDDLTYAFGVADEPNYKEIVGGTGTDVVVLSGFNQPADFCPKRESVDVRGTSDFSGGTEYKLKLTDVEFIGAIGGRLYNSSEFQDWLGPLLSPKLPPLPPISELGTTFTYRLDDRSSIAVDLDKDGYDEIIVQTSEPGEVELNGVTYYYQPAELKIYSTDQLGALSDVTRSVLGAEPVLLDWSNVTIASDFNQDGYPDLFFCDSGYDPAGFPGNNAPLMVGRQNLLLLSTGGGRLTDVSRTHLPQLSDFCHGASSGDIDKDGDDDIWVSNLPGQYAPAVSYLLENDGTGKFTVIADIGHGSDVPGQETYLEFYPYPDQRLPSSLWNESFTEGASVAWWSSMLDVTGDGADEIIMWSAYSTAEGHPPIRDILLINDGNGFFSEADPGAVPIPSWGLPTSSEGSRVLDVNGDGRDDVFVMRAYGDGAGAYQLLINNGDGTFTDETISRMPGVDNPSLPESRNYSRIRVMDFDNDGDDDLSIEIDFVSTFFVNDGAGHFTQQITISELSFYHLPIDLKADGKMDFVAPVSWGNGKQQLTLGVYLNIRE
jgi:hypothetical protein